MSISHDSEIHTPGQQVLTACAFIHKEFDGVRKLFLPKRADTKKFLPGVFELPGGHVDYGEELVDGLKREILEEFEMQIEVGDPFFAFTYVNEIKESHSLELIYFARFTDPVENIKLHPEDHSEYKWFAEDELHLVATENKMEDDIEIQAMKKGFGILNGESINALIG